jgi:hypothetical protein
MVTLNLVPLGDERITDVVSTEPAVCKLPSQSMVKAFDKVAAIRPPPGAIPLPKINALSVFGILYLPITN